MAKTVQSDELLRIKVDLPNFQLEVASKEPGKTLTELRRVLESLQLSEDIAYEQYVVQELRSTLSAEFVSNQNVMAAVREILKQDGDYRLARTEVDLSTTIDLIEHKKTVRLERIAIVRASASLLSELDCNAVRSGIVHVKGALNNDERLQLVDNIHKRMPNAKIKAFHTVEDVPDKVLVEAFFFGDFDDEL